MSLSSVRKGQVFTPDFAASIALFSLFLLMFGLVWNTSMNMFVEGPDTDQRQHHYSFSTLKTSGSPTDWNSTEVNVPGLYKDGYLSAEKFLDFYDLQVAEQRRLLGVEDFYLRIQDMDGEIMNYSNQKLEAFSGPERSTERNVPANVTVYASRQLAVLRENGERAELRYYTWEN